MDEAYYRNYLQNIYEDPETNRDVGKVYAVDPLLFSLRRENGVIDMLSMSEMFNDISGVVFRVENKDGVLNRAKATEAEIEAFPFNSTGPVPADGSKPFQGSIDREIVAADLTRGSTKLDPTGLLQSIVQVIQKAKTQEAEASKKGESFYQSHKNMDNFMHDIHQFSGMRFMTRVQELVRKDARGDSTNKWENARYTFGGMSTNEMVLLMDSLSNAADIAMKNVVNTHVELVDDKRNIATSITYLDDLKMKFRRPIYYRIKMHMLENIQMPRRFTVEANEDKVYSEYLKMLVVDVYIKTCFPVLIYYYISNMAQTYARLGDFVNARVALLAKVMYTYFFVRKAVDNYYSQDGIKPDQNGNIDNDISDLYTILNNYLHKMNSSDIKITEIIKEVHNKSNEVVDKNRIIQRMQENIRKNQLAMRNVLYNVDEMKKKYALKKIELMIISVVLLALIVSCSVLIAIKMNTIVLYVAGGVAIAILAYGIIKMVLGIIKNNK